MRVKSLNKFSCNYWPCSQILAFVPIKARVFLLYLFPSGVSNGYTFQIFQLGIGELRFQFLTIIEPLLCWILVVLPVLVGNKYNHIWYVSFFHLYLTGIFGIIADKIC